MTEYSITSSATDLGSAYVGNETLTATITVTETSGIVTISDINFSNKDFYIDEPIFPIKYNTPTGAEIKMIYIDSPSKNAEPAKILKINDNYYQFISYGPDKFNSSTDSGADGLIVKYDSDLNVVASEATGTTNDSSGIDLVQTSSNNLGYLGRESYTASGTTQTIYTTITLSGLSTTTAFTTHQDNANDHLARFAISDSNFSNIIIGKEASVGANYLRMATDLASITSSRHLDVDDGSVRPASFYNGDTNDTDLYMCGFYSVSAANHGFISKALIDADALTTVYGSVMSLAHTEVFRYYNVFIGSSNVYACGISNEAGLGVNDGIISAFSSDLSSRTWSKRYRVNGDIGAIYEMVEYDGYIYAVGAAATKAVIIKIDPSDGSAVLATTLEDSINNFCWFYNVIIDSSTLILGVRSSNNNGTYSSSGIMKINTDHIGVINGSTIPADFTFYAFSSASITELSDSSVHTSLAGKGKGAATGTLSRSFGETLTITTEDFEISGNRTASIGINYRPTIKGSATTTVSFTTSASAEQTATLTGTGLLINPERDYKIKAQETWGKIALNFYGNIKYADFLISQNPHLTMKQKKGIFAPKGVWINVPELTAENQEELTEQEDLTPWYQV